MQFVGYYVELYFFLFRKRCQIVVLERIVLRYGIRFHLRQKQ